MTMAELDLNKFQQQMKSLNESFLKRYDEIKQYLDKIEVKKSTEIEKQKQQQQSTPRTLSATSKQSSK